MKLSRLLFLAIVALLVFVTGLGQSASAKAKKPVVDPPVDGRKMILSVDAKASSIVIEYMRDKSSHPYKIDGMTVLKINNQTGKVDQIKAGMVVDDAAERDFDTLDSLSLSGYGGPIVPLGDPKKKK